MSDMPLASQNPEESCSQFSDEFINFWVPVIRKLRETTQFASVSMLPSMNKCVEIINDNLKEWESKKLKEVSVISNADIFNACMTYRHDFGLFPHEEQKQLKSEAKAWFLAWQRSLK